MSSPETYPDEVYVAQLLVSPVHRFSGRPAQGPSPDPGGGLVREIHVRRRLGIVGDRYFAQPAHRDASVTIMAEENLPTGIDPAVDLRQTRRNILLRGVDIDACIGWTVHFATWCRGEAVRWGGDTVMPYAFGEAVEISGVCVSPGDYVYMDSAGGVVIPPSSLHQVFAVAEDIYAEEADAATGIRSERTDTAR
ncbi:molybdenum cofactor biosysynthesis protein [Streptomyces sp. NPDC101225]|uniref:molybdenum cofactor biosysynthesis protein n=1 Tax=Streptomyces sp. NPDC101225 TaxID=3366135 RepID=UPI00380B8F6A